jgi:alanyl-tRNA synthetase
VTTRLYYSDSLLCRFDASVTESGVLPDGRPFVVLDQTAFYPTSGGQPHDVGQLGDARVTDVIDREEDHAVLHVIDKSLAVGAAVSGEIDRIRRHDHIQQHSGQHVLSAAFVHACNAPTVSFHLGADTSTIDVAATLDAAQIASGEDEANRVVLENRPVVVRYASSEDAARLPLRKESKREGTLRLVDIEGWDLSACGGTHVTRTGGIGCIVVTGWERYKGGTRVGFACGLRAVRQHRAMRDVVAEVTRALSVQPGEVVEALRRLQAESRDARQQARVLTESLAKYEAQEIAASAEERAGGRIVVRTVDREANGLKLLAQAVAALGPDVVFFSTSRPALVVAARGVTREAEPRFGSTSVGPAFDAKALVAALIARFGGKGGGRPEMAQAGGLDADADSLCAAARAAVTEIRAS